MKRTFFLTFMICFFMGSNTFAKCMTGHVLVAPRQTSVLPANATVIVTFFGSERAIFAKNKNKKFFFKSGKEKVEAKFVEEWNSELNLEVFRFKATKNLKVGNTYYLQVNGKRFSWKVGKADTTKPKWASSPKEVDFKKVKWGCGLAVNFVSTLYISDTSPVFYEVVMKTKDDKIHRFFVQSSDRKVPVGYGLCRGGLVPKGNDGQVEMTPYDFAGNKGETKSIILRNLGN